MHGVWHFTIVMQWQYWKGQLAITMLDKMWGCRTWKSVRKHQSQQNYIRIADHFISRFFLQRNMSLFIYNYIQEMLNQVFPRKYLSFNYNRSFYNGENWKPGFVALLWFLVPFFNLIFATDLHTCVIVFMFTII
jgi:hypothetical protein